MKRPEYVAIATRLYRQAIDGQRVSAQDMKDLRDAFSRQGFTQGYYVGQTGRDMFGTRQREKENTALMQQARAGYENNEAPLVPVRFYAVMSAGQNAMLAVQDELGNIGKTEGPVPQPALRKALTQEELHARLSKTGGTPYACVETKAVIDPGLTLPAAAINAMRREVLTHLTALRGRQSQPSELNRYTPPKIWPGSDRPPVLTVGVLRPEQITPKLLAMKPAVLYVPLQLLRGKLDWLSKVQPQTELSVVLPRIIQDRETAQVRRDLDLARSLGIRSALCGNLGHLGLLRSRGFAIHGDYGLNLFNSRSMNLSKSLGLQSATVSFELTLPQIRDLSKPIPTELLAYGRLPLMLTENCILKNRGKGCHCEDTPQTLTDRKGESFPVEKAWGCRNELFNPRVLWLADRKSDWSRLGASCARLAFLRESPAECTRIFTAYRTGEGTAPEGFTRGLYDRGVE